MNSRSTTNLAFALIILWTAAIPGQAQGQLRAWLFGANSYHAVDSLSTGVGQAMAYAGDLLGDGTDYVLIGEPDAPGGGMVWLQPIPSAFTDEKLKPPTKISEFVNLSLAEGDRFGHSVAFLGDLNKDGFPELAIGAPGDDKSENNGGAVWMISMPPAGSKGKASRIAPGFDDGTLSANAELGFSVAHMSRDISGRSALLIGVPGHAGNTGGYYLCNLIAKSLNDCTFTTTSSQSRGRLGHAVTVVGQADNDGFIPLAISEPLLKNDQFVTQGRIWLQSVKLSLSGVEKAGLEYITPAPFDNEPLGSALAGLGDLTGDGVPELLIGAAEKQLGNGGSKAGRGYVAVLENNNGTYNDIHLADFNQGKPGFNQGTRDDLYGTSFAVLPRESGLPQLLVGIPGDDRYGENAGALQLLTFYEQFPIVAQPDHFTVYEDSTMETSVLLNDLPVDAPRRANFLFVESGSFATLSEPDQKHSYTSAPDFNGTITATYWAERTNGSVNSGFTQARITIDILPVEDPPRIGDLAETTALVDVLYEEKVEILEVDGDPFTTSVIKKPDWLATVIDSENQVALIGTPQQNHVGNHEVIIRADDGKGATNKSLIITVPAEALATPVLVAPADGSMDQETDVTLSWDGVQNANTYAVEVAKDSSFKQLIADATTTSTVYALQALDPGFTYFWRVQAKGDNAESVFSSVFRFTTLTTVSSEDETVPRVLALEPNYPNPFSSQTTVKYTIAKPGPVRLVVYDLLGRAVRRLVYGQTRPGTYEAILDAGNLPSGIYILQLHSGAESKTRRITLMR